MQLLVIVVSFVVVVVGVCGGRACGQSFAPVVRPLEHARRGAAVIGGFVFVCLGWEPLKQQSASLGVLVLARGGGAIPKKTNLG